MCTGTELLFLPGSARFLSDWSAAGGIDGRIQVFLLCGRVSSVVWLDLRTIYLRMAVSVRAGTGSAPQNPGSGKTKEPAGPQASGLAEIWDPGGVCRPFADVCRGRVRAVKALVLSVYLSQWDADGGDSAGGLL